MKRLLCAAVLSTMLAPCLFAQTFYYLENRSVSQLDPFTYFSNPVNDRITSLLFGSLFTVNTNSRVVPDMAEAITADRSRPERFTIRLRANMLWRNGTPVSTHDVIHTVELIRNSNTDCTGDERLRGYVGEIASMEFVSPLQFAVTFKRAISVEQAMVYLMLPIVPKDVLKEGYLKRNDPFTEDPVGSGPFYYEKWDVSHYFVRNRKYHGGEVNDHPIERVVMTTVADNSGRNEHFLSGKYHLVVDVPPGALEQLRAVSTVEIKPYESLSYDYIGFNFRNALLRVPEIREAMSIALDRRKIITDSYGGAGVEVSGPFPPGSSFVDPDAKPDPYDPRRAREMLDAIGARVMGGIRIRQLNGQPLVFRLVYPEREGGEKDATRVATLQIQGYLRDIGIEVLLEQYSDEKYRDEVVTKHNFDLAFSRWRFTDLSGDPSSLFVTDDSPVYNYIGYSDQRVDLLFAQFRAAPDSESRKGFGRRIHRHLAAERPYIFLWSAYNNSAINRERIRDVVINPYSYFSTITGWKLIK